MKSYNKIIDEIKRRIITLYDNGSGDGQSMQAIADMIGVSKSTIQQVIRESKGEESNAQYV